MKRKQSKYMKDLISGLNKKKVLQVDFSENASITSQNEVQSAHCSHGSATLFTAHAWVSDGVTESMVFISDEETLERLIFCYVKRKQSKDFCHITMAKVWWMVLGAR